VTNAVTDADVPANGLSYALLTPPAGAAIGSNGVITWTPTLAQGPSTNTFAVKVTDNGVPSLSATQTLTIVVNEVNLPPILSPIPNQTNSEQTLITFTATASDSDIPANTLTFSLDPGAPAGTST